MKKLIFKVLTYIIILNIITNSCFFISNGYGILNEIDSEFGESPVIDGFIDYTKNEWNKATKVPMLLEGLPITLWVMQDDKNLFILVKFDLESYESEDTEFIGIIISNSSSILPEEFIDAKIIQFYNKTSNDFDYLDYHINNSVFLNDTYYDGLGAAKKEGKYSTYEFSIPLKNADRENIDEDVFLDYGNQHAFNLTYGNAPIYPEGIRKRNTIIINIKSPSTSKPLITNLAMFILAIVIFSIIAIIYGFYIYKIFKLKEKIERIKR
ncbi:MAG: hypothetical protein ACFE9I_05420 [Candidatus Hermodarchaeota archaeon]